MAHGLTLSEVAAIVAKLKMYPYFDVANYILMTMMVREDSHPPPTSGILLLSQKKNDGGYEMACVRLFVCCVHAL